MPIDPAAPISLSAFHHAPPQAQGLVRDLRVRWALEEIGRPYRVESLDAFAPRPEGYLARQPFGQVPAIADADLSLFESGAILLYLGEQDARLMPRDPCGRWRVTSWLFAALNSVEPMITPLVLTNMLHRAEPWADPARQAVHSQIRRVLGRTSDALAEAEWIAGDFSIADIALATVLRPLDRTPTLLAEFPALVRYKQRAEDRPAFRQALADHLATFREQETAS